MFASRLSRTSAARPIAASIAAMVIALCTSACTSSPGSDANADATPDTAHWFDAGAIDRVVLPDIGSDLPPADFGAPPDVGSTCGLMVCGPGQLCCTWTLACYEPAMSFLCPQPDGTVPWDGGRCGSTTCAPGTVCCAATMRCVDPTVPSLCPSDDAGRCAGVRCSVGWRCCPTTGACFDDRVPELCPLMPDAGLHDARTDGATDARLGPVCGTRFCAIGESCCAATMMCYDAFGCPDCCR